MISVSSGQNNGARGGQGHAYPARIFYTMGTYVMMGMIGIITILGITILGKIIRMDLHMLIASSSKASTPAHHVHQVESHHPFCHHHHHNGRAQGGETGEMNGVADLSSAWQPDKLSPSPSEPLSESPPLFISQEPTQIMLHTTEFPDKSL